MTAAVLPAAVAGALAVAGAWEVLATIEGARAFDRVAALAESARGAGRGGVAASAPERRRLVLLGSIALAGAGWVLAGAVAAVALGLAGPTLASRVLRARRRRHVEELERAAPAVARAIADALSGGHSVIGALDQAASGAGAAEAQLRAVTSSISLGDSPERALERLRARAGGAGFELIVAAILLQRRAGGDLPRALRGVADAVEERERLERDARAATAQARFTGLLVCCLPAGAAGLAELASPGYLAGLLRSPLAATLAVCAGAFQLAALVVIRRLARVRA